MPSITFLGRHKTVGSYQLTMPTTIGRSLDCDVYIPDIFVSRLHCRFEPHNGLWQVVDLGSSNGVWVSGKPLAKYLLKPGDVIEVGTVAIRYNGGDLDTTSNPAPFGMGLGVTELMDTICTEGIHPSRYTKQQASRKEEWRERARRRLAMIHAEPEPVEVPDTTPWAKEDWAELDLELQIAAAQDASMKHWRAPIFNPEPWQLQKEPALSVSIDEDKADYRLTEVMSSIPRPAGSGDSVDEELEELLAKGKGASPGLASGKGKKGKAPLMIDGVEIEEYGWGERVRDSIQERFAAGLSFARLNPAVAAAVVLGSVLLLGGGVKLWQSASSAGYHHAKTYSAEEIRAMNQAN